MQVKLVNHSELKDAKLNAIMRKVEGEFPENLSKYAEEFKKEDDKEGLRSVHIVDGDQVGTILVNTVKKDADLRSIQKTIGKFFGRIKELKVEEPKVYIDSAFTEQEVMQIAKFFALADNAFDMHIKSGYKNTYEESSEEDKKDEISSITLYVDQADSQKFEKEANNLAKAIAHTRELVNQPANIMTPTKLSEEAKKAGTEYGFEVEIFGPERIKDIGMDAFWSVAKGSSEEPRFIIMRYKNNPDSDKTLALVGKGLCYDSGGYDIKPGPGMRTMNSDMAGSAAVIGTMSALAANEAKVNVVAIIAACENMVSGHSFRNGDIIGSLAGKTIEIMSTDAEGRLTLADAVTYAWKEENADAIVDIATLTGAIVVALGDHVTGAICDNDDLAEFIEQAADESGDKVHILPIDDEYEAKNKSDRADIKNGGIRGGGSITAGLFVRAFANDVPFLHLDIAGTSYNESGSDFAPKGATGVGAELLYNFAKEYFGDK